MRIGIDTRYLAYPYTGIPIFVHDMLYYFNMLDNDNEYYLYTDNIYDLDFELNNNFHICKVGKLHGIIWVLFDLGRYVKKDHIDLLWEPMHFLPIGLQKKKKLLTVHDCAVFQHPEWGEKSNAINHKLFFKASCKSADHIMAISNSTKQDIIKYSRVDEKKISVIYNGDITYSQEPSEAIIAITNQVLEKYTIKNAEYFVFVSTIEPRKNVITIIKAFEEFKKEQNDLKLVLVGKKGWKTNEFDDILEMLKCKRDIIITGYVSEAEKEVLLRNSLCLLYPSLYEGFGFPPLEAMSVGVPVITTRISSLPEVCGDAALYLEDPYDYCSLMSLMKSIQEMRRTDKDNLIKKGLNQTKLFSRKECAKIMIKLFREL